ncbi:MAG: ribonuclease PH, partial [Bifidobacterium sp.]
MAAIKDMLDSSQVIRSDGRAVDALRPVKISRGIPAVPEGSV